MSPFPHPSHRTGHADFPHPALGQDFTPSPTGARQLHRCAAAPERRRAESAHVEWQALNPADDQQRAVFDIVVGVMVRDEDRLQRVERDAGTRVLVGNSHAAIKHIGHAVAQHHV
jgi:hypothetical protein